MPVTSGTVTDDGPVDTVIVTVEPLAAWAPAAGSWETTSPLATLSLACCRTAGTNPAVVRLSSALACWTPTTFGTATCGGGAAVLPTEFATR